MSGVLQVKGNSTVTTDKQMKATAGDKKVVKRVVRRVVGSGSLICFPSTWFLTLAIIATWSAVAVITFDLVNFHTYLEPICDGPCPLPVSFPQVMQTHLGRRSMKKQKYKQERKLGTTMAKEKKRQEKWANFTYKVMEVKQKARSPWSGWKR